MKYTTKLLIEDYIHSDKTFRFSSSDCRAELANFLTMKLAAQSSKKVKDSLRAGIKRDLDDFYSENKDLSIYNKKTLDKLANKIYASSN